MFSSVPRCRSSVGTDQDLLRVTFNLLCFRQDRDPVAAADFSSVLVDQEGARHADRAQREIGIEIVEVRSCGKAQKQEQRPHKQPDSWNAIVKSVRHQHRELPSEAESSQIMNTRPANVPDSAHIFVLLETGNQTNSC